MKLYYINEQLKKLNELSQSVCDAFYTKSGGLILDGDYNALRDALLDLRGWCDDVLDDVSEE